MGVHNLKTGHELIALVRAGKVLFPRRFLRGFWPRRWQ